MPVFITHSASHVYSVHLTFSCYRIILLSIYGSIQLYKMFYVTQKSRKYKLVKCMRIGLLTASSFLAPAPDVRVLLTSSLHVFFFFLPEICLVASEAVKVQHETLNTAKNLLVNIPHAVQCCHLDVSLSHPSTSFLRLLYII